MDDGLDAFLRDWEGQLTTASPGYYEGQKRGYLFGGSADLRFPNRTITPITLSLPSVKAGCGGISFFGGAFSFINMQQFTQYLQAIAQNALGMAFNMGLSVLCPQCATVLSKLEDTVRNMTGNLKSSCNAARALLSNAGLTPDNLSGIAEQNCQAINTALGVTDDSWGGAFKCAQPGARQDADAQARQAWRNAGSPKDWPTQGISINVFWEAWMRVSGDLPEYTLEFAEQLMSLIGTVVISYQGTPEGAVDTFTPRLQVGDLLSGWEAGRPLLTCSGETESCLTVTEQHASRGYAGLERIIHDKLTDYATALATRQRTSVASNPYITSRVMGFPIARLLINTSGIPDANQMIIETGSRLLAIQILRAWTNQLTALVHDQALRVSDKGGLNAFLEKLRVRREEITRDFDSMQTYMAHSIQQFQALAEFANAGSAASASAFARHAAFAAKLTQNANTVGTR
jgi:conjugative transfer pilus assembly protein TraH